MDKRLKILFLTPRLPYPVIGGDRLKPNKILSHLAKKHDVTLVSFYQTGNPPKAYKTEIERLGLKAHIIPLYPLQASIRIIPKLFVRKPLETLYYTQPEFRRKVNELLKRENFDLVFSFFMRTAEYVKKKPLKKILMGEDCRTLYQYRSYKESKNLKQKVVRLWEYKKLKHYEPAIVEHFDCVTFVTHEDIREMKKLNPLGNYKLLTNGTDINHFIPPNSNLQRRGILFAGKLDVWANQLMVQTIVNELLPIIRREVPAAELYIVGAKPPAGVLQYKGKEGIHIISDVPDMMPYLQQAQLFLHPHNGGSGIQNKLLEAMACGCPVVTTPTGNQGINAKNGVEALIGDTFEELAQHAVRILKDKEFAANISSNCRELIVKEHSWESVYEALDKIIMETMNDDY